MQTLLSVMVAFAAAVLHVYTRDWWIVFVIGL